MHIPDGSHKPYIGDRSNPKIYMWGWLGNSVPTSGWDDKETKHKFLLKIKEKERDPTHVCKGFHTCEICKQKSFNGEIIFYKKGRSYIAPCGVSHYIESHDYKPNDEVINVVLNS